MNLTVLTCTGDRPSAFALCESYVARQTKQPSQVLVLDDGDTPTVCTKGQDYVYCPEFKGRGSMIKKIRKALKEGLITGDAIVWIEDDDRYSADYLEWVADNLSRYAINGEGHAVYYNVQGRWWHRHTNMKHASLCSTSITKALFPWLLKQVTISECPFLDVRLWNRAPGPAKVHNPGMDRRRVVGIKGMPGRAGYGSGHTEKDRTANLDPDMSALRRFMGEDANNYAPFYVPALGGKAGSATPEMDAGECGEGGLPRLTAFAKGHGPNWTKWLAHLKDKPAVGIEIGTFQGESAEWTLSNILTHPESVLHCVDPFTGSPEHQRHGIDCTQNEKLARERLARFGERCQIHVTTSDRFLYELNANRHQPKVDCCYVDGLHSARGVLHDMVLGFDLLKVGGVMVADDYAWTDMPLELDRPKMAVDAFYRIYSRHLKILTPMGWQRAFKKISE